MIYISISTHSRGELQQTGIVSRFLYIDILAVEQVDSLV